jgi:SCY1-like protein 1
MAIADPRKRPTADALLGSPLFNSEHLSLLASLGDLAIKPTAETITILTSLLPKLSLLPKPVCVYKIIPAVSRILEISLKEFSNRDNRESSRQAIDQGLSLLSELSRLQKIEEGIFSQKCVPVICSLWALSDRSIRTSLLKTCKHLVPLVPAPVFNKQIFESMLAGFSDSNAKMREETLKNLIFVVDKLDEKQFQEKLVRCITSLQQDAEASIRTNVTIFLGKIASRLREAVRSKLLVTSFVKSMKDQFVHCRIAGLRASLACLSLVDVQQQMNKHLMPQLCILLTDRSAEVRELSMQLIEACLPIMRQEMKRLTEQEQAQKARGDHVVDSNSASGSSGTDGNPNSEGSWMSWAVDGLAKGLEKAAIASAGTAGGPTSAEITKPVTSASNQTTSSTPNSKLLTSSVSSVTKPAVAATPPVKVSKSVPLPVDPADDDFDDWDDQKNTSSNIPEDNLEDDAPSGGGGWGDDDFDIEDDEDDDGNQSANNVPTATAIKQQQAANVVSPSYGKSGSLGIASSSSSGTLGSPAGGQLGSLKGSASTGSMKLPSAAPARAPAPVQSQTPTKTAAVKSAWDDDDDDMFDALETKPVEPKAASSSKQLNIAGTVKAPTPPISSGSPSLSQSKAGAATSAKSAKKPAVTKLAVDANDAAWDDF